MHSSFADISFSGIASDSRLVKEGDIFFALCPKKEFLDEALARGCCAIVLDKPLCFSLERLNNTPIVIEKNIRQALDKLAFTLFQPLPPTLAAVTGTNGKTSSVEFTNQIWKALGLKSASLGTLGLRSSQPLTFEKEALETYTTPESVTLYQTLNACFKQGITHVALEASSHGLSQYRLHHLPLSVAGFTQLGRDHLDYHKTIEDYVAAKCKLFTDILPSEKKGVLCLNDLSNPYLKTISSCVSHPVTVGLYGQDIQLLNYQPHNFGQKLTLRFQKNIYEVFLPIFGRFQAYNILLAIAMVLYTEPFPTWQDILALLPSALTPIPGRLEKVDPRYNIYIDYAHTPDALENALLELRAITQHNLSVIFGCGGMRDKGKRRLMGAIAQRLADNVYITDDNPRFEDPQIIRSDILEGCPKGFDIPDRKTAITTALLSSKPGDTLLIAGKGHEEGQNIEGILYPFSDKITVKSLLQKILSP